MHILGFPEYQVQTKRLADELKLPYREISVHRFPDGERKITVPTDVARHVVVCLSLDHPDTRLVELLLAAGALRDQGVTRITLVAPYLCYMRQDIAFRPGEAISQRLVGQFLAGLVDDLVTVDPHLHRTASLQAAVPVRNAVCLSAAAPLGDYIVGRWHNPLLLGPDGESEQWVRTMAKRHGLAYAVARKQRLGDREVRVTLPQTAFGDRQVVLVDDVASSGHTLIETARLVAAHPIAGIAAVVTHALFDSATARALQAAGISAVASSDSITHPSNAVALSTLLADAVARLAATSDSSL